jgi:hypothetical protein
MYFNIFAPTLLGGLNGYTKKEGGVTTFEKVTILSLTTTFGFLRAFNRMRSSTIPAFQHPPTAFTTLLFGIPLIVGTSFCTGHHFGKALRRTEDERSSIRG